MTGRLKSCIKNDIFKIKINTSSIRCLGTCIYILDIIKMSVIRKSGKTNVKTRKINMNHGKRENSQCLVKLKLSTH